ncbi:MAG: hypothetical protein LW636_01605, partial [Planctomycetaceae bacterium]|nr:hypothetical protein [Planctomycetaceae bacterium]
MSKIRPFLAAVVTVHAFGLSQALAATLQVPSQFPTIQSAVNAAVSGDEIVVAPGVYASGFDYSGKRLTVRSSGGAATTIIDLSAAGGTAVLAIQAEQAGTRLEGFTLRAATDAAVRIGSNASLDVVACRIQDCTTSRTGGGAAIAVVGGDLSAVQCEFRNLTVSLTDVSAAAVGGAVSLSADATALFSLCTFETCTARAEDSRRQLNGFYYPSARGGAISASASVLLAERCTFSGCRVEARRILGPATGNSNSDCYAGWGSAIGEGGAIGLESSAFASIDTCTFGATVGCRADARIERQRYTLGSSSSANTPREVYARGGAVSAVGGSRVESRASDYRNCTTLATVGNGLGYACGSGSTVYSPVFLFSEGAGIYAESPGAPVLLSSTLDLFEGGRCLMVTELPPGVQCCEPCASNGCLTTAITSSVKAGAIRVRPGSASTQ